MAEYLAPGVYVEEVPSGVRVIEGASTSVTAFVGVAERGDVDAVVRGLEVCYEDVCPAVWLRIAIWPELEELRSDPRVDRLLVRIGADPPQTGESTQR